MSEDELAGWHHQCNGHDLGQISGDAEGQGGQVCCSPWGPKELDMDWETEQQQQIHKSVGLFTINKLRQLHIS